MNKRLLIINTTQFGYHTDAYEYSRYLKIQYEISFLCFDTKKKKMVLQGVDVKYVSYSGSKKIRGVRFFIVALFEIMKFNGGIMVIYFDWCNYLKKAAPAKRMILDIRTLSIRKNALERDRSDKRKREACFNYDFVTIISEGVRNKLQIPLDRTAILPLGSDPISFTNKDFLSLRLVYVGTLNNRNIWQTVEGLSMFVEKNCNTISISYDIIGDGMESTELKNLINTLHLESIVAIHGRIPHDELMPFFDKCNIGVSHIPITEYYDYQPPTKTYEYIMSGIFCLATNTQENSKIINDINGILYEDNPISFADALNKVMIDRHRYNSQLIRETLVNHTWSSIVHDRLIPILERVYNR